MSLIVASDGGPRPQQLLGQWASLGDGGNVGLSVQAGGRGFSPLQIEATYRAGIPGLLEREDVTASVGLSSRTRTPIHAWTLRLNAGDPPTAGAARSQINSYPVIVQGGRYVIRATIRLSGWVSIEGSECCILQLKHDGSKYPSPQAGGQGPPLMLSARGGRLVWSRGVVDEDMGGTDAAGYRTWAQGDNAADDVPSRPITDGWMDVRIALCADHRPECGSADVYMNGNLWVSYRGATLHPPSIVAGGCVPANCSLALYEYARPKAVDRKLQIRRFEISEAP
jgi:hypothetical protein